MSGSTREDAMVKYKRALEAISMKKATLKRAASGGDDDDIQFIGSSKRKATATPPSTLKKTRGSRILPNASHPSSDDQTKVLASLTAKVFPSTPACLPEGNPLEAVQSLQGDLLQVKVFPFCLLIFELDRYEF